MIPHDSIRKNVDRSWSLRLVDEIAGGRSSELEEIYETLEVLDDPRVLEPLTCLLENRDLPEAIRRSASDALCMVSTEETSEQRFAWWASNDPVLVRHAIMFAEGQERDLVEAVARDPSHVFHLEAIEKIQWWDNARFQALLVEALKHPDVRVRAQAAEGCKWEEPVRAQEALLEIASAAQDADRELVEAALRALLWHPSRKVLLSLDKFVREGHAEFHSNYVGAFDFVRERFQSELGFVSAEEGPWLYAWVKPVAHLLDLKVAQVDEVGSGVGDPVCSADSVPGDSRKSKSNYYDWNCQTIISELEIADGYWCEKLPRLEYETDWQSFTFEERKILADFLSRHPDAQVRVACCKPLGEWGMVEHLVCLLADPNYSVAKYAAYCMCKLPRDEALAPALWRIFQNKNLTGDYADDLFTSYLLHAPDEGLDNMLVDLAANDDREGVIVLALNELSNRKNFAALQSLMYLLKREPLVSWRVHINLIDECYFEESLSLPDISHLMEVDNLHLQSAISEVLVARNLASVKSSS